MPMIVVVVAVLAPVVVLVMVVIVVVVIVVMMVVMGVALVAPMAMIIVFVLVMIVSMMIVRVVTASRRGIGAAFGIERRLDERDFAAKAARHVLDDVITSDPQGASGQFHRQVAIAEMPGDPGERDRVLATDFGERFWRRDHFHDAPVIEQEAVAAAQHHGLGQVEEKGEAAHARHRQAAAITIVIVEHDGIGRRAGPGAGGAN